MILKLESIVFDPAPVIRTALGSDIGLPDLLALLLPHHNVAEEPPDFTASIRASSIR